MLNKHTIPMKVMFRYKILFLLATLLLAGGNAFSQVQIDGNVYGGCNLGRVTESTTVTVNGGTIGTKIPLENRVIDAEGQVVKKIDYGNVYGGGNGYEVIGTQRVKKVVDAPVFDSMAGQVMGNTYVTIGGNAVVRHAVFGGGNIGSVGTWSNVDNRYGISQTTGVPKYCKPKTGVTTVIIKDSALIGPTESDLTEATNAELTSAGAALKSDKSAMDLAEYIKQAFHYLGGNEGFVFGGSRGLSGGPFRHLSFVDSALVTIQDGAQAMNVFGGGDNGHVYTMSSVIIKDSAVIGGIPIHGADYAIPIKHTYNKGSVPIAISVDELVEDSYGVGTRLFRGYVFGGGKGNDYITFWLTEGNTKKLCYTAGRVYGFTRVTIQDKAQVYNRVYGGGTIASVGQFKEEPSDDDDNHTIIDTVKREIDLVNKIYGGNTYIYIKGGTIGSPGSDGINCGEVYGGGRGQAGRSRKPKDGGPNGLEPLLPLHQVVDEAYVGNTYVEVTGGTIMSNVYGGGANGHVEGDAIVLITADDPVHPPVIGVEGKSHGWHGNVYGGGGGTERYSEISGGRHHSITAGRVFGNTNVTIEGGTIVHNVYGGGALASVGTYLVQDGDKFYPYKSGGIATVNIIGGTIGTDGNDNGMVFGSGRGEIAAPDATMDTLTYVAYTQVNIGKDNGNGTYGGNAKINGSVYGSGENGHVFLNTNVNIYGGTIGCTAAEYTAMSDDDKTKKFPYRGNVYGAGCGTDKYLPTGGGDSLYNPMAGVVQGNTNVDIYGGYISRNVYGGGAMASVGTLDHTETKPHILSDTLTKASLSWPYELEYISIVDKDLNPVTTGLATVNIYGGHIGTHLAGPNESGCVFGSSRGNVGPLGVMDSMAIVRTTDVKIDFDYTDDDIDESTANCIIGSVFGSGEDGTVYEDTKVTLTDGRISGSIFGGGSGTSTYDVALKNPDYDSENPGTEQEYLPLSKQRSLTAGKVYGNTEIIVNDGWVEHNIYGGGNMASVGKGNYIGYGEICYGDIASTAPTDPYENSGICKVTINGGTIGTTGYPDANGVNNGYVFGASRGITFATVNKTPRYNYSRDFFLGYCNETEVIIGDASLSSSPSIKGSVFGGGDNGHVRWNTKVTVNKGEIGETYTYSGTPLSLADSLKIWTNRGNVYGAGRGADKIPNSVDYCPSAGSVTLSTNVEVYGGTIHRNVYGGGSMASVGPPPSKDYNPGTSKCTVTINGGTIGQTITAYPDIYGGNIYGAGRGTIDEHFPLNMHATSNTTEVYIDKSDGIAIPGDVYGGGSYGQVKSDTKVYMNNGTVKGSVYGAGMGEENTREAGQVLGNALVEMSAGTIERSIYGGGHVGSVGTFETYYTANLHDGNTFHIIGEPKTYKTGTGLTKVLISGGQVGVISKAHMPDSRYPGDDEYGYVFAAGQGIADSINNSKANLLAVNCSTYFEMSGGLVTASVYGGAENGQVMGDTYVKIKGGQIGIGCYTTKDEDNNVVYNYDGIYTDPQWDAAITAVTADDAVKNGTLATYFASSSYVFHECDHWPFGVDHDNDASTPLKYYTYDIYADKPNYNSEGGSVSPSDGHTFYGNVFGGGSGYYPFWSATENKSIWRRSAGRVCGNTRVDIEGGHILTSVYGGNEQTDVIGSCTVNMSGGTIGVPRTVAEITSHPVTCYLFGAGKGDQRILFNEWTNVENVEVNISGGYIFGSVFGGGEDGHVLGNVVVNIKEGENGVKPFIGTWGTSYVDGNVFGGGRGFSGDALTAGAVCGNVNVNISAGTMLGSIYGGGRLASVGTYLAPTTIEDPEHPGSYIPHPNYGIMRPDNGADTHGHIVVNISGGIIGNTAPYVLFAGDDAVDDADKKPSNLGDSKYERLDDETVLVDTAAYILRHPISGNVFGGSMGRTHTIDGNISDIWPNLAKAKSTRVIISGDAVIRSSVYGGGEIGTVVEDAIVTISGGTIGTDIVPSTDNLKKKLRNYSNAVKYENFYVKPDNESDAPYPLSTYVSDHYRSGIAHYYFGSVFGGGYGSEDVQTPGVDLKMNYTPELINYNAPARSPEVDIAGRVYGNTYVYIKGGTIRGDVYGGGDIASVGTAVYDNSGNMLYYKPNTGACSVVVSKETVDPVIGPIDFTSHNANVYAGGRGVGRDRSHKYDKYCNVNSSTLTVSGGRIWGCTFGGGADCHVLNNTQTNIQDGADIGDKGITEHDGCVFGGGRNYYNLNPTAGRVQGNAQVDVTGGRIRCSVFAGGSMARTGVDIEGNRFLTDSALHGNTIVNVSGTSTVIGAVENSVDNYIDSKYLVDCDYTIGDVYGGGKGDTRDTLDVEAGRVSNTFVNVTGSPLILGDIYGGGEMACVGYWDPHKTINGEPNPNHGKYYSQTGYTHVVVSGNPSIGTPFEFSIDNIFAGGNWSLVNAIGHLFHTCSGNVYGGSLGFIWPTHPNWVQMGRIRQSYVTFNGGHMLGNIFGGGSRGIVMDSTYVKVTGGTIGTKIDAYDTIPSYYYGSVFGGGYGNPSLLTDPPDMVRQFGNQASDSTLKDPVTGNYIFESCVPTGYAGRVYGNTHVEITGGRIMDCVFGGGDIASVGFVEKDANGIEIQGDRSKLHNGKCYVKVGGNAIIGPLDGTGHNAYVYGAGRGEVSDSTEKYKRYANVNETHVTIELTTNGAASKDSSDWKAADGGRIWGSIFGGGADSHVLGDAYVNMVSGVVGTKGTSSFDGNIFGGGRNFLNTNHTNGRVQDSIFITMTGGHLQGSIFGGGRLALSGVDVDGHFIDNTYGNVDILVKGDAVIGTYNSRDLFWADESVGDIFGAGKGDTKNYDDIWAGRVTNSTITIEDDSKTGGSPRIHGSVFGGGEMASLGWWDDVIVVPDKDEKDSVVFHTKNIDLKTFAPDGSTNTAWGEFYPNTGKAVIKITSTDSIGTWDELTKYTIPTTEKKEFRTYSADGPCENPGDWTSYADDGTVFHTCTGNVFGGCQGDVDIAAPHWVSMGRTYESIVTIGTEDSTTGPQIMGCVFGGGEQGSMLGDAHVTVYSGTIGTHVEARDVYENTHVPEYIYGDVYGAGFGSYKTKLEEDTYSYTEGNVTHSGKATNDSVQARKTISLGLADTLSSKPSALAGRVYGDVQVDMLGGHVLGSVYGGGSFASVGYELGTTKGNTLVNIGTDNNGLPKGEATIDEAVFGANNFSGTPYGNARVHIYKTAHTTGNELTRDALTLITGNNYPTGLKALKPDVAELTLEDIDDLTSAEMTSLKDDNRFAIKAVYGGGNNAAHTPVANNGTTLVHVHYCKENTICDLYGGGNAANTVNNHVIIDGGYFKRIFGGGNSSGTNNHANVTGTATTQINGGLFHEVYGGSNEKGTVGSIVLDIDEENDCDELIINGFGGNNEGTGGGGTITIGCGTKFYNFYAGANNATITGDIDVTIKGGQFQNFYGGNNQGGSINGDVTVNYRSGHIGNLFGGSNIGGAITGKITVNVFFDETIICPDGMNIDYVFGGGNMAEYNPNDDSVFNAPVVNIYKGIINYEVYGGGKGGASGTAEVTSNTEVNIGRKWKNPTTHEYEYHPVFIGRDPEKPADPARQNEPVSETNPKLGYHSNNGNVFGGGNASPTTGNTLVRILNNSHVFGGVYGGGNNAIVTGNTDVIIGE